MKPTQAQRINVNQLYPLFAFVYLLAICTCAFGCNSNPSARYKPASATARQAIETALAKWKAGAKYGANAESTPTVIVEEPRWKSGSRLESYDIVEEVPGKDYPQFKVKLKLAGKPEELTEYLVVGIDPPIVYSKEEYERASGKASGM